MVWDSSYHMNRQFLISFSSVLSCFSNAIGSFIWDVALISSGCLHQLFYVRNFFCYCILDAIDMWFELWKYEFEAEITVLAISQLLYEILQSLKYVYKLKPSHFPTSPGLFIICLYDSFFNSNYFCWNSQLM